MEYARLPTHWEWGETEEIWRNESEMYLSCIVCEYLLLTVYLLILAIRQSIPYEVLCISWRNQWSVWVLILSVECSLDVSSLALCCLLYRVCRLLDSLPKWDTECKIPCTITDPLGLASDSIKIKHFVYWESAHPLAVAFAEEYQLSKTWHNRRMLYPTV